MNAGEQTLWLRSRYRSSPSGSSGRSAKSAPARSVRGSDSSGTSVGLVYRLFAPSRGCASTSRSNDRVFPARVREGLS